MTFVPNRALTTQRKTQKLSQQDVADRIGVSRESLGMWERGERHPSYGDVLKWAVVLGFPLAILDSLQEVDELD
ncbi:helix-turn-helix transcriptional regulator [Streptomyces sp. NPDC058686]|uniref:helix-turn-helix transcriptional regulator n=1 Tax=Streptomyces sp. NPDC058686 TaxID=3346599 RepID=UPI003656B4D1